MYTDYPRADELPIELIPDRIFADALYSAWLRSLDAPVAIRVSAPYSALTPAHQQRNREREARK